MPRGAESTTAHTSGAGGVFPIVRHPAPGRRAPIVVSVPHYGTEPLPQTTAADYREPSFATFAYGFADAFAGDLYGALHEHGATVLATPLSRMFVDVNRRRDDVERRGDEVWSKRGVVRTHTMRETPIFARPLTPAELEARLRAFYDPYYATLGELLGGVRTMYGHALLLDGHTGSPRRMNNHRQRLHRRQHRRDVRPAARVRARAAARDQRRAAHDVHRGRVHRPGAARRDPREEHGQHRAPARVPARGGGGAGGGDARLARQLPRR